MLNLTLTFGTHTHLVLVFQASEVFFSFQEEVLNISVALRYTYGPTSPFLYLAAKGFAAELLKKI